MSLFIFCLLDLSVVGIDVLNYISKCLNPIIRWIIFALYCQLLFREIKTDFKKCFPTYYFKLYSLLWVEPSFHCEHFPFARRMPLTICLSTCLWLINSFHSHLSKMSLFCLLFFKDCFFKTGFRVLDRLSFISAIGYHYIVFCVKLFLTQNLW